MVRSEADNKATEETEKAWAEERWAKQVAQTWGQKGLLQVWQWNGRWSGSKAYCQEALYSFRPLPWALCSGLYTFGENFPASPQDTLEPPDLQKPVFSTFLKAMWKEQETPITSSDGFFTHLPLGWVGRSGRTGSTKKQTKKPRCSQRKVGENIW